MPHNKTSLFAIILCVSLLLSAVPVYSQTDNPDNRYSLAAPPKFENPKLDSTLNQLIDAYEEGGIEGALAYADQHLLEVEGQRVQITAFAHNDYPQTVEAVKQAIENLGGDVQTWWGSQVQGMVPIPSLNSLAAQEVVHYVRDPLRPALDVTSEGVGLINADDYRSVVGTSGEGVKIAIVDLGFINYQSLQSSGELPGDATIASFRADGEIESETEHGAGCAEIVYDIAPDAAYYFVNYGTDTEYFNAVDYLESESVDVVSHSISWFLSGAYDGSSDVSQRIDTARSNGIFWANSAGNYADQHWEGYFDNDGSGNHIWDSGSGATVNELGLIGSGVTVTAYLSWDNWVPLSTNDYDMYLMYSTGGDWSVEASSTTDQSTGDQPPTEDISYKTDKLGFYGLLVTKVSGSDQYLDLFTTRQSLEYPVAMGSVPNAADAAGAITVAAVDASDYNATGLESYSSHGPTNATGGGEPNYGNGSYTKPDISGPDKVSTVTYGTLGFGGTSASTPHTAGAATLYMSGYNNAYGALPTVSQTQTYLENCAEEKYDWGTDTDGIKNNQFGAGGLYMCQTPTAVRVIELYALNAVNLTLQALAASVAFILIVAGLIGYHARKKEVKTN